MASRYVEIYIDVCFEDNYFSRISFPGFLYKFFSNQFREWKCIMFIILEIYFYEGVVCEEICLI